jgi:NAD(P)-dependent dehydrogenase (short-subunit alcohol dehydrogenase family)
MGRVAGKVAIVTGAASGMGKADAQTLAAQGARVVVTDLNEKDGQAVAAAIGENAIFLTLNVTDEENWKSVIAATVETFGRLDILVNNAGMIALGTIVDTDLETWRMINAVNSDGVFLGCKHAIPAMADSGGGSLSICRQWRRFTASLLSPPIRPARGQYALSPRVSPCTVRNRRMVSAATRSTRTGSRHPWW